MLNPSAQSLLLNISPQNSETDMRSEGKTSEPPPVGRVSLTQVPSTRFRRKNDASNYLVTKSSLRQFLSGCGAGVTR